MFRTSLLPYCSSCREYVASYWTSACHCIHDCRMRQLDALVSVTPYKVLQERAPIKRNVRVHVERTLLSPVCRMWSLPIDLNSHQVDPPCGRTFLPTSVKKIVRPHGGAVNHSPTIPCSCRGCTPLLLCSALSSKQQVAHPGGVSPTCRLTRSTQVSPRLRCAAGWSGSLAYPRRPFSCFVFDRDVVGKPPS